MVIHPSWVQPFNLNLIYETLWTGAGLLISRDKWLVDFDAGKARLVLFDLSTNTSAIDVKIDGSVLEEKSSFKMPGLTFSSELGWDSYIIFIV